jgi:hypothetical protein
MDQDQWLTSEWQLRRSLERTGNWAFAKWFAAIAFVAGGSVAFYLGYRQFRPPPPPPGTALCGNAVIGGLAMMVIGAPVVAIACSVVAATIGSALDCILAGFET